MKFNIRLLYLYLFSFVGLLIAIIGSVQLVDLGLKTYVFKVTSRGYYSDYPEPKFEENLQLSAEELDERDEKREERNKEEESNDRRRQMSNSLSMIIVGTPLYLYHWKTIKKEKQ